MQKKNKPKNFHFLMKLSHFKKQRNLPTKKACSKFCEAVLQEKLHIVSGSVDFSEIFEDIECQLILVYGKLARDSHLIHKQTHTRITRKSETDFFEKGVPGTVGAEF